MVLKRVEWSVWLWVEGMAVLWAGLMDCLAETRVDWMEETKVV